MTTTLFRWEQDGAGGEHGKATYFPDTVEEITLTIGTFVEAHELHKCIEIALQRARSAARSQLVNEIKRINP